MTWTRRAAIAAALALLALIPSTASANGGPPSDVTVMSRNIYLGGDIFRPIGAPNLAEFERQAGLLWQEVRQTNFPFRSKLLAREVQREQPDLIGLQEVALWRRGPQGLKDGATTPARRVVYDFLAILRRELRRLGLNYRVAVKQREADIEAPIDAGYDVRLTMHDVILVRRRPGLRVRNTSSANYDADISVPTAAGPLTSTRGWTAVDATLSGSRFRFVNTHLESALDSIRVAQATELVGPSGPLRARRPVILVGDFNSDPEGRGGERGRRLRPDRGGGVQRRLASRPPERSRPHLRLRLGPQQPHGGRLQRSHRPDLDQAAAAGPGHVDRREAPQRSPARPMAGRSRGRGRGVAAAGLAIHPLALGSQPSASIRPSRKWKYQVTCVSANEPSACTTLIEP